MTERAEGFWWVRLQDWGGQGTETMRALMHAWSVVEVADIDGRRVFAYPGVEHMFPVDEPNTEWGPYLGKEPAPGAESLRQAERVAKHDGEAVLRISWKPDRRYVVERPRNR